ncbi:protein serine/threonine phosphatase 2C [Penicillium taxi]|uniref:protein serine/threonine phosphatase 2C n=1 Tax=Penicillium taxi TaxID=168475 RepID=UPI002544F6C2|nr:protein serine/threonine phosphatase 2C [Penicillium taxi]KAJ5888000.1 protein serine/threonine phosphatase 2C [Penicillium taxi]
MLLLGVARTRLRMNTTSILKTRIKKYSIKGSGSGPSSNPARNFTVAVVVGAPSLWWLLTSHDNVPLHDVPLLDSPPTEHCGIEPSSSKNDVTRIISQGAYSFPIGNVVGVSRYDGAQLASNSPCEDRFTHGKFPSPSIEGNQWMAWGVFDGHSGCQTAELLKEQLLPFVRHSLNQVKPSLDEDSLPVESVQRAIMDGFVKLDDSIIKTAVDTAQSGLSLQEKVKRLAPAHAGSCALLSMYDPISSWLHVACTGDSRAVLGQKGSDGKWEVILLSEDQNGSNYEEIARLQKEHPGEDNIVKHGRVLGIMVSRAFGDARWKWPLEFQEDVKRRFFGPAPLTPRYEIKTPPYLTARPVVTSVKIDPTKPSFLIMATDGLWDLLYNGQAVDLVGDWLESEKKTNSNLESTYKPFDFSQCWDDPPVYSRFVKERTTVQDDNAAVHLVRNALGGNHHEMIAGRLAFSAPSSRNVRDDITVQVAFFNVPDKKK